MSKIDQTCFLWGALFGAIAPFIGLFIGSQILPILGSILMFPIVLLSKFLDKPFGEFSTTWLILSFILSVIFWGGLFVLFGKLRVAFN